MKDKSEPTRSVEVVNHVNTSYTLLKLNNRSLLKASCFLSMEA